MIIKITDRLHYWGQLLLLPVYWLSFLVPRDKKIWLFGSTFGRRFADNPWVRAGITQKFDRSIFKKKQQAVLFCMKFRLYQGLYLLQKMKEQKKN